MRRVSCYADIYLCSIQCFVAGYTHVEICAILKHIGIYPSGVFFINIMVNWTQSKIIICSHVKSSQDARLITQVQ